MSNDVFDEMRQQIQDMQRQIERLVAGEATVETTDSVVEETVELPAHDTQDPLERVAEDDEDQSVPPPPHEAADEDLPPPDDTDLERFTKVMDKALVEFQAIRDPDDHEPPRASATGSEVERGDDADVDQLPVEAAAPDQAPPPIPTDP